MLEAAPNDNRLVQTRQDETGRNGMGHNTSQSFSPSLYYIHILTINTTYVYTVSINSEQSGKSVKK